MLIGRDSVNPYAIPLADLAAYGGYADGLYEWTSAGWARFPTSAVPLAIAVRPGDTGDIADFERGDFTAADAPAWVLGFNRAGRRAPTNYVSRANWPDVVDALGETVAATCDWFVATLDGTTDLWYGLPGNVPPSWLNVVAIQWKGSAQTGGDYDEWLITDPTWIGLAMDGSAGEMAGGPPTEWGWWPCASSQ